MNEQQDERRKICREHDLDAWTYIDIPLKDMPGRFGELIAQFGPDAVFYIGGDNPSPRVEYSTPETDEELAKRLEGQRIADSKPALCTAALAKLTKDEATALGVSAHLMAKFGPAPSQREAT